MNVGESVNHVSEMSPPKVELERIRMYKMVNGKREEYRGHLTITNNKEREVVQFEFDGERVVSCLGRHGDAGSDEFPHPDLRLRRNYGIMLEDLENKALFVFGTRYVRDVLNLLGMVPLKFIENEDTIEFHVERMHQNRLCKGCIFARHFYQVPQPSKCSIL